MSLSAFYFYQNADVFKLILFQIHVPQNMLETLIVTS